MPSNKMRLLISSDYIKALQKLSSEVQAAAINFLTKLRENPSNLSLNIEKLNVIDPSLRSGRVNRDVRVILSILENGNTYCLLYINHHQEAYRWAEHKQVIVNEMNGQIELFDVISQQAETNNNKAKMLFDNLSNSKLEQLGLSALVILAARTVKDKTELQEKKDCFTESAYEILSFYAEGCSYEEVLEYAESSKSDWGQDRSSNSFFVIDDEECVEEYKKLLDGSIADWRIFLHPSQRKLVETNYSGPVKVLGEAGTGKTVVAMHRACRLAKELLPGEKILFTTFTSNLAVDIESNLSAMCGSANFSKIETVNIDKWVANYLRRCGENDQLIYGNDVQDYWKNAIANTPQGEILPIEFYMDEWERVIIEQNINSLEDYKKVQRIGRGFPLSRRQREVAWFVFQRYHENLQHSRCIDIYMGVKKAINLLLCKSVCHLYTHIIVDEVQDFSQNMLKMLRAIAGSEHENDIFLVGDARQNIYGKKVILRKSGINTIGRSFTLRMNYRTTDEIRRWAINLLLQKDTEDLDGQNQTNNMGLSLIHGKRPDVQSFMKQEEENIFIAKTISDWMRQGYLPQSICITAKTKRQLEQIKNFLTSKSVRIYELKGEAEDKEKDGVRIATMHRIKGIEFDCIVIYGLNDGMIPSSNIYRMHDETKRKEMEATERSLLYVAATRAKKELVITSTGRISELLA